MSTPCSLEICTGKEREANQVEASIRIPDVFGSFRKVFFWLKARIRNPNGRVDDG